MFDFSTYVDQLIQTVDGRGFPEGYIEHLRKTMMESLEQVSIKHQLKEKFANANENCTNVDFNLMAALKPPQKTALDLEMTEQLNILNAENEKLESEIEVLQASK